MTDSVILGLLKLYLYFCFFLFYVDRLVVDGAFLIIPSCYLTIVWPLVSHSFLFLLTSENSECDMFNGAAEGKILFFTSWMATLTIHLPGWQTLEAGKHRVLRPSEYRNVMTVERWVIRPETERDETVKLGNCLALTIAFWPKFLRPSHAGKCWWVLSKDYFYSMTQHCSKV